MVGVKVLHEGDEGVIKKGHSLYYGFVEKDIEGKSALVCSRCQGAGGNTFHMVSHIFGKCESSASYQCDCGNSLGYVLTEENPYLD